MPENRDTIVYAWNYVSWGGAQIYFLGLIKKVSKHFTVKIVIPANTDPQLIGFFEDEGVETITFEPSFDGQETPGLAGKASMHRNKFRSESAMLKAIEGCCDFARSIIHIELGPWQSLNSMTWLLLRAPVFITMHNSVPARGLIRESIWKAKMKAVSRWSNFHPFTSNRDTKEFFSSYYSEEVSERILVTYTSVNPNEIERALKAPFDRTRLLEKQGIPTDKLIVLALGQFIDRKGRWEFLEAARTISKQREDVHFVWISNLELSEEDKLRVDGYGLERRFSLLRSSDVAKEHLDLFVFMRAADVFVLPSHVEGLPISLLEAMALGIPSISTSINAIPEAIENGVNGTLVPPRDSDSLQKAILELLDDQEKRRDFGEKGRVKVLDSFNEEVVAEKALRAYLDVSGEDHA